jgi:hypothetical protein
MSGRVKPKLSSVRDRLARSSDPDSTDSPERARYLLAVTDVPALLAALDAVLDLHTPYERLGGVECAHDGALWPCATYIFAAEHIDVEG